MQQAPNVQTNFREVISQCPEDVQARVKTHMRRKATLNHDWEQLKKLEACQKRVMERDNQVDCELESDIKRLIHSVEHNRSEV
jgi:hypothetical protein